MHDPARRVFTPQETEGISFGKTLIVMEDKTLEERLQEDETNISRALMEVSTIKSLLADLEKRVDAQERQNGQVLDTTKEIKDLLTGNNKDTKSAKRNAKGWGFASVFLSVLFKVGEIVFRSKVAL